MTTDETFLWYRATDRLQLGVAFLLKQGAFRGLATYAVSPETERLPSINASAGVQGIGTGNPGYSLTAEKNWFFAGGKSFNLYGGVGFRANENHVHAVAGAKVGLGSGFSFGMQDDGHDRHAFVTYTNGAWIGGLYLVRLRSPGFLAGIRF